MPSESDRSKGLIHRQPDAKLSPPIVAETLLQTKAAEISPADRNRYGPLTDENAGHYADDYVARLLRVIVSYPEEQYSPKEREEIRLLLHRLVPDSTIMAGRGLRMMNRNREMFYAEIQRGIREEIDVAPGFLERAQIKKDYKKKITSFSSLDSGLDESRPLPVGYEYIDVTGQVITADEAGLLEQNEGWQCVKQRGIAEEQEANADHDILFWAGFDVQLIFDQKSKAIRVWCKQIN